MSGGFKFTPIALLASILFFAAPAIAQSPPTDPKFGGCLKNKATCFGPSVTINLLAINLRDGTAQTDVVPGVGYGVTFDADKWHKFGIAGYVNLRATSTGKTPVLAIVGSFAEYLNVGLSYQVGGGGAFRDSAAVLLGLGSTFGSN